MEDRRQAAEELAIIRDHQRSARQRARLPWWVYAAMFVLIAGVTALNDVVSLTGAKVIAVLVLVAFIAVMVITFATGQAPLSLFRGVQRRQVFAPRAFAVIAVLGGALGWLTLHYLSSSHVSATELGLVFGALCTGLFALSQRLSANE